MEKVTTLHWMISLLGYLQEVYDQLHVLGEEGRRKAKETALDILKRIGEINTQGMTGLS